MASETLKKINGSIHDVIFEIKIMKWKKNIGRTTYLLLS